MDTGNWNSLMNKILIFTHWCSVNNFVMRIFLLTIFFFIFSSFAESKSYEDTKRYKKDLAKISKHNAFRDNNWEQYSINDIGDFKNILLIIWNDGTRSDAYIDPCWKWRAPSIISNLHNKKINNLTIKIYDLCSGVRGWLQHDSDRMYNEMKRDNGDFYRLENKYGVKLADKYKALLRQNIIINKVDEFLNKGFENIVLSGQSGGAWVSLNLQSRFPDKVDGAIVFAPAVGGTANNWKHWKHWGALQEHEMNIINKSDTLNALVFSHKDDPWHDEYIFSFFEKFHKMNIIDPSSSLPCKTSGHGVAYSDCFELYEEENKFIENYLKKLF